MDEEMKHSNETESEAHTLDLPEERSAVEQEPATIPEENRSEEQSPAFPEEEPTTEPTAEPTSAPTEPENQAEPQPSKTTPAVKQYSTGTKIAAFIFFAITLAVFIFYEIFSITFLYSPFANSPENLGEAIAVIFGYTFGLVITIIFGIAQLPENIISIILFARLRGKSNKKWENVLFTVFFALSIAMLAIMILSFALFMLVIAAG